MILAKEHNVGTELLEDMALAFTSAGIFYVFFLFLFKRRDIRQLIQELENYDVFGKPEDAENLNRSYNFYSKLYYLYCCVATSIFFVLNQTIGAHRCREKNVEFNRDEVCGLFMHVWLPFDYNFTPLYEVMVVLTYLIGIYAGPVLIIFFLVFVILQHLTCKIRHLKQMAEGIFKTQDLYTQRQKLITCIRYHQYIIRF